MTGFAVRAGWRGGLAGAVAAMVVSGLGFAPALAQDEPAIEMELNRLEDKTPDCTAWIVVKNRTETAFTKILTELAIFDSNGIFTKRLALDIAPLTANKTRVLGMRISEVTCGSIGKVLLNTVSECRTAATDLPDCVSAIDVTSRSQAVPMEK